MTRLYEIFWGLTEQWAERLGSVRKVCLVIGVFAVLDGIIISLTASLLYGWKWYVTIPAFTAGILAGGIPFVPAWKAGREQHPQEGRHL